MSTLRSGLAVLLAATLLTAVRAEDEKQKAPATSGSVRTTGKVVIVGADGKVTEKALDGGEVKGFAVEFKDGDVKGGKAVTGKLTVIYPDGTKKEIDLGNLEGDKSAKVAPKVIAVPRTVIVSPEGKKIPIVGAGAAPKRDELEAQIRKSVEEALQKAFKDGRGGKVDVEALQQKLKALHGVGPAVQMELRKAAGKPDSLEATLEKILSRLEKLEKAVEELKRK